MPPKHRSLINGPGGLRLQDVATSVGLIHLVILHFFGSRDGLMRALNERILEDLRGRLISILERRDPASPDSLDQLLDGVFTVFRGGLAQWLVWLGADAVPADNPPAAIFRQIRGRDARIPSDHAAERDGPLAPDTKMLVYLVAVTALSDAVSGPNCSARHPGRKPARPSKNSALTGPAPAEPSRHLANPQPSP
jgi:AcrR family transcriptional regulator